MTTARYAELHDQLRDVRVDLYQHNLEARYLRELRENGSVEVLLRLGHNKLLTLLRIHHTCKQKAYAQTIADFYLNKCA